MTTRTPLDTVLDLTVFAPIGLAVSARRVLPVLAAEGRERVESQLTTARLLGELAVRQGKVEAEKAVARVTTQLTRTGWWGSAGEQEQERPPARHTAPAGARRPEPTVPTPTPGPPPGDPAGLAIPGYDSLSASQVVPRLEGLTADELEAVRHYESASRRRKTILNRVAQLQAS